MALRVSPQAAVVGRVDYVSPCCSASTARIDCGAAAPASSRRDAELSRGSRSYKGTEVCQGPLLKSRVSSERQESLSSSLNALYQTAAPEGFATTRHKGFFINEQAPRASSTALIDIEDGRDGSILFKYGSLEDLWDMDRLLKYLCCGAFTTNTVESFVAVVVELFKVPVSSVGQRRMVDLLSSYVRLNRDVSPIDLEEMVSQLLAECTSEYLPPPNVGAYSKGRLRPSKRFSSRVDKWWKTFDNFFVVEDHAFHFEREETFPRLDKDLLQPYLKYNKLNDRRSYEPLMPDFTRTLRSRLNQVAWKEAPAETAWLGSPSNRPSIASPHAATLEFVRGDASSSKASGLREDKAGLDFVLLSPQVSDLEDVPGELEDLPGESELEESISDSDILLPPPVKKFETLPTSSIRAMIQWEREEVFVTSSINLPRRERSRVKVTTKKATQRTRTKATQQQVRGKEVRSRTASKRRTSTERREESQLCDMFFGLPLSHKCSGVASFLAMRKDHSQEMLVVLNQVAVGLAGAGLAFTLHVGARMLSLNSTFDSSKMFGLIRGAALLWVSVSMQSLRRVMLRLPPGCTINGFEDKEQLLCLQRRLRSLSFRALTVMVLIVVCHGL